MRKSNYRGYMVIGYQYENESGNRVRDEYLTWVDPELVKEIRQIEKDNGNSFASDEWEGVFNNIFEDDTSDWDNFEVCYVERFKMFTHEYLLKRFIKWRE